MMSIDDNGYIEYSIKKVYGNHVTSKTKILNDTQPFYLRYLNRKRKSKI